MSAPRAPLIIAGMHRSGTTLLCRMLIRLGVFLGWRREENEEARTFLEINKWLLLQAGSAWDFPPDPSEFDEPEARDLCRRFMTYALNSVWMSFYLGRPYLSMAGVPPRFPRVWGWKDPRNTLTLPLWADLYPDATVVHVTRHGVDVSHSLVSRRAERIARLADRFPMRRHGYWFRLRKRRFETGHGSLEAAFALWERYMELAEAGSRRFARGITVRFEDLVAQPGACLSRLSEALDLEWDQADIEAACALPRPGRAHAWRKDPALTAFAEDQSESLTRWGYDD